MYKVSATMFYHFFKVSFPVGTLLYVFTWENLWCEPSGVKLLCVVDDTIYWSIYMLKTLRLLSLWGRYCYLFDYINDLTCMPTLSFDDMFIIIHNIIVSSNYKCTK